MFTLDPYVPEYNLVQVKGNDSPEIALPQGCQEWESNHNTEVNSYQIMVSFQSSDYGSFQQRLVFDFAEQRRVFRQLEVVVAPEQSLLRTVQHPVVCDEDSELSWLAIYPLVPFNPQGVQGT